MRNRIFHQARIAGMMFDGIITASGPALSCRSSGSVALGVSGLPLTLPFGIPTYWSPEAALAIFEFIDDMRDVILATYCTQLQEAARKQRQSPADRMVIPDDELPF
jgi:hypothetical protein